MRFVLFTRADCPLCETAWNLLVKHQEAYGFHLQTIDIDADPTWRRLYDHCVPVVEVNGEVRFRGQVNEVLLKRLLDAGTKN